MEGENQSSKSASRLHNLLIRPSSQESQAFYRQQEGRNPQMNKTFTSIGGKSALLIDNKSVNNRGKERHDNKLPFNSPEKEAGMISERNLLNDHNSTID